MKPIAIIVAGLLFTACQEPEARSPEEEANLAAVKRYDELLNQHTPREDYYDDFYAADYVLTGFTSVPPFRFSLPLEQLKKMDDRARDRKVETHSLMADGGAVVQEKIVTSSGRDIREVSIRIFKDGKIAASRNYSVFLPLEGDPLHRTPQERAAVETVERFVKAYNAQEEGWFARFHSAGIAYVGVIPSRGRIMADFVKLKAMTDGAMRNLPDRHFVVAHLFVDAKSVVLEGTWTGTASPEHPMLDAGHRVTHHYTGIYRIEDGKFVELREYLAPVDEAAATAAIERSPQA